MDAETRFIASLFFRRQDESRLFFQFRDGINCLFFFMEMGDKSRLFFLWRRDKSRFYIRFSIPLILPVIPVMRSIPPSREYYFLSAMLISEAQVIPVKNRYTVSVPIPETSAAAICIKFFPSLVA
jgi:hypothetical protein